MKEYLLQERRWLKVERLPGYAPDLNPVETLWGNIKGQELANRVVPMISPKRTQLSLYYARFSSYWADCRLGASGGRGVCVARARAYSG
jgi:DDE superfamily endonuclease